MTKKSGDNRNRANEREHEKQNFQMPKVLYKITSIARYIDIISGSLKLH